ncbi:glycerol-3-phosphate acyltransferase [Thermospira aquatica]|uniref:Glycerol-3-phosphate acyltransferase n=1 Tax=Thermospira aquatica TaxID=2828656 RepID=A0AAX3BFN9_9SPIR|nr:glycerol-3-phosphate acyltransferase [Thermospira aquatica]URA11232.1 glycerol-3-phosphate acyltransferase [Thermospira aquatica]
MTVMVYVLYLVGTYLLGAIPFGLVYGFMRGVDIRTVGSKNIGATNVSRVFGFWGGFVPVFVLDFLKGGLPVFFFPVVEQMVFGGSGYFLERDIMLILIGVVAILGHLYPVYLGFKGGKGVATSAGVFSFLAFYELLIALGVFLVTLFGFRLAVYLGDTEERKLGFFKNLQKGVGLSSVLAAVALPLSVWFLEPQRTALKVVTIVIALLVIVKHRKNLAQLFGAKS